MVVLYICCSKPSTLTSLLSSLSFSLVSNSMRILVTSDNSGLIETVRNTISIHSIKKDAYARRLNEVGIVFTLYDYFQQVKEKDQAQDISNKHVT